MPELNPLPSGFYDPFLLPALPAPLIFPAGGNVEGVDSVGISVPGHPDASIFYTVDGSIPDQSSQAWPGPITLALSGVRVTAAAFEEGWLQSPLASVYYQPSLLPSPAISGTRQSDQSLVELHLSLPAEYDDAFIFFTVNQSDPSPENYAGVRPAKRMHARARSSVQVSTSSEGQVQLADGTFPVLLSTPIKVKAVAVRWLQRGSGNPRVSCVTELVFGQPTLPPPTFFPPNQSAATPLNVAVSIEGHPDALIRFNLAGAASPTDDTYLTPIYLESPAALSVWATKPGYNPALGTSRYDYLITPAVSVSATPAPGLIELGSSVILNIPSDQTSIFYTVDGSVPTVLSKLYSSPIQVSGSTAIKALGVCAGFQDGMFSGVYTVFVSARATVVVDATGTLTPFVKVSGTAPVRVNSTGTLTPFVKVSGTAPVRVNSTGTLTPRGIVLSLSAVWSTAVSDDGAVVVAAAVGDKIYVSVDSGDTWDSGGSTDHHWHRVACSGSGSKIVALASVQGRPGGPMLVSSDCGTSWAARTPPLGYCQSVCLSRDGSVTAVLFTELFNSTNVSAVYVSHNFGVTWKFRPFPEVFSAAGMAMSDDGSKLAVVSGATNTDGTRIFVSSDCGLTWVRTATGASSEGFSGAGTGISMKGDGSEVFVCTKGFNAGFVWSGSVSGNQWLQVQDPPAGGGVQISRTWTTIGTSRSGITRAGTFQGELFLVDNQTASYSSTLANFPNTISLSEDGTKVTVGPRNGPIYRSNDSGLAWATVS